MKETYYFKISGYVFPIKDWILFDMYGYYSDILLTSIGEKLFNYHKKELIEQVIGDYFSVDCKNETFINTLIL